MKILYIITKSNWGGAQKYVFDLALSMKEKGCDVSVAFGGDGILKERLMEKSIRIIQIKNLERDVSIKKELKVFKDIYNLIKKENPDIIHLNSSKIGAMGGLIGRLVGIKKIIFTAHGWPFREDRPFWQIVLISILSWLTVIFSNKTICVSKKDFNDIKKSPFVKDKIITIHNGIEIKNIQKDENLEENQKVKIVSIGELHKNKGFEYGVETINILKNRIQNFSYTIFSFGGDEKEKLEKLIKEKNLENFVELKINNENHSGKLKDFDIYFMPSIKEGLPYVLLEAGLNHLPIVASDTGGIDEIVENYKNGFLISLKDINGFELALEKLILDKKLRQDFGKEARKKIENSFDIKDMFIKTEEIYKN